MGLWESGLANPLPRHYGQIVRYLGFDPGPTGESTVAKLEAARRALGLTQREFAAKVGLDEGSLCRWARGSRTPSLWMAGRLKAILAELAGESSNLVWPKQSFFDITRWRRSPVSGLTPSTLGERLRFLRLDLGLSQVEAGKRLGVCRDSVHRWERGDSNPKEIHRKAIRTLLGGPREQRS